jgi:membrane protease YdiL (CAAX protease family)
VPKRVRPHTFEAFETNAASGRTYHHRQLTISSSSASEPGAGIAELLHTVGTVFFGFAGYAAGQVVAAEVAYYLPRPVAYAFGFLVGLVGAGENVVEIASEQMMLVLVVITWLLLALLVLRFAARFATPRHRARSVWILASLIGVTQALRALWPNRPLPWVRFNDVWSSSDSSSHWILAYIQLPRHPLLLASCVALVPAIAWYSIVAENRARARVTEGGDGSHQVSQPSRWRVWELPSPPVVTLGQLALLAGSVIASLLFISLTWRSGFPDSTQLHFANARILATLFVELGLAGIWLPRLKRQGWKLASISRSWRASDAVHAIGLTIGAELAVRIAYVTLWLVDKPLAVTISHYRTVGPLSWWVVVPMVLVNPLFEEVLYFGYIANVLRSRWGIHIAFTSVLLLRMLMHLYQGPLALIGVFPLAIIFTLYYLRTGRLWPLVIAHAVLDCVALGSIALRP